MKNSFKFSKRSLRNLRGVEPIMIAIFTDAIKTAPHDFGIPKTGGKRSAKTQNELYNRGWSKLDGYNKKSYHQTGRAIDIYAYVNGKLSYDKEIMKELATHIKSVAKDRYNVTLVWGGDWKTFIDLPHFQISKSQV